MKCGFNACSKKLAYESHPLLHPTSTRIMKVIRYSTSATIADSISTLGNVSFFVKAAISGYAKSKSCTSNYIETTPALNVPKHLQMTSAKFSLKVDPEWHKSMLKIADKVVTDRPRGERFSRFVSAAIAWRMSHDATGIPVAAAASFFPTL